MKLFIAHQRYDTVTTVTAEPGCSQVLICLMRRGDSDSSKSNKKQTAQSNINSNKKLKRNSPASKKGVVIENREQVVVLVFCSPPGRPSHKKAIVSWFFNGST